MSFLAGPSRSSPLASASRASRSTATSTPLAGRYSIRAARPFSSSMRTHMYATPPNGDSAQPSPAPPGPATKELNQHQQFYRQLLPAMAPIFLLGSAVYMTLHLAQMHLAQEKWVDEAQERIARLEEEVQTLRASGPPKGSGSTLVLPVTKETLSRWKLW